jgi:hypothetical protein
MTILTEFLKGVISVRPAVNLFKKCSVGHEGEQSFVLGLEILHEKSHFFTTNPITATQILCSVTENLIQQNDERKLLQGHTQF